MRITGLRTYVMGTSWRNLIFIEVDTDEGITGVGEATLHNFEEGMVGYLGSIKDKYVIGRDPFDVERLSRDIQRDDFWLGGPMGVTLNHKVIEAYPYRKLHFNLYATGWQRRQA